MKSPLFNYGTPVTVLFLLGQFGNHKVLFKEENENKEKPRWHYGAPVDRGGSVGPSCADPCHHSEQGTALPLPLPKRFGLPVSMSPSKQCSGEPDKTEHPIGWNSNKRQLKEEKF